MDIKCVNCEYFEGTSKKNGKPYKCVFVTLVTDEGAVRVPLFLPPWDWKRLGVSDSADAAYDGI